jgi:hypothetical protein
MLSHQSCKQQLQVVVVGTSADDNVNLKGARRASIWVKVRYASCLDKLWKHRSEQGNCCPRMCDSASIDTLVDNDLQRPNANSQAWMQSKKTSLSC